MINRTHLMRRINVYCQHNSGGKRQSGETLLARGSGVAANIVPKLRNGAEPREETLAKIDRFLRDGGF